MSTTRHRGRPQKYSTQEDRIEARRRQTRIHVRQHRARKRLSHSSGDASDGDAGLHPRHLLPQSHGGDPHALKVFSDVLGLLRLDVDIEGSQLARESFHSFRHMVTSAIFWRPFWQDTVLPACHAEPVILNATLALSAVQFRSQASDRSRAAHLARSALLHQSRASRMLRRLSAADDTARHTEVALITSIIFTITAYLSGDVPTAILHVEHGLRLLEDFAAGSQTKAAGDRRPGRQSTKVAVLTDILRQMYLRALLLDERLVPSMVLDTTIDIPRSFSNVPQSWNTVSAITLKLLSQQRRATSTGNTISCPTPGVPTIEGLLEQWHRAWEVSWTDAPPCERALVDPWTSVPFDVAQLIAADGDEVQSDAVQACCERVMAVARGAPRSRFQGTDRLAKWPLDLVVKRALDPGMRSEALTLLHQPTSSTFAFA